MEAKVRKKKTIEEQEALLMKRLEILEQQKKRLTVIKDKQRTRRLILLGTLLERSLENSPQNKGHFARMADSVFGKRPNDLALLKAYLGSGE